MKINTTMKVFHRVTDLPHHVRNFSSGESVVVHFFVFEELWNIASISNFSDNEVSFLKIK